MDSILDFKKAFSIRKEKNFSIVVPKLPEKFNHKAGIYQWVYKGKVIKVGIFGEGVSSSAYSRYASYRSVGKTLFSFTSTTKTRNGSVKPMEVLNKKLKQGDRVEVHICRVPEDTLTIGGIPYKVDLYILEEFYKNKNRETLWLS